MRKIVVVIFALFVYQQTRATIHVIRVWNGYMKFVPEEITIQLGDTIHWLPLDEPVMVHTVTSTTIPSGAVSFNVVWQAPADTFFEYVPAVQGVYNYQCNPHASTGMTGMIEVLGVTGIIDNIISGNQFLFPNPAREIIFINDYINYTGFQLYDNTGRLIRREDMKYFIEISSLNSGIYYLMLVGDTPKRIKFLKE